MKRLLLLGIALLVLAAANCTGESKSSECCDEACRIWAACGWSSDVCLAECRADGDWCGGYIDCIRGRGCGELLACE